MKKPRHENQLPLTVNVPRENKIRSAARKFVTLPGRYGSWYEERQQERAEQMDIPPEERPGAFRTVANGDFSEEEIREMEKLYRAPIIRSTKEKKP